MRHLFNALLLGFCIATSAAEFTVKTGDQPAPTKVSEPIRALLSSKPIQLLEGDKTILQIWFQKEIPLKSKPSSSASALNAIPETTVVAVVSVEGPGLSDYKDNDVPKGVFTARFVLQPQDGNHLGTAEFSTFLALLSADTDKALDTFTKYTPMVKASGKLTSTGHPLIISLRPVSSPEGSLPKVTEPVSDHKAIRVNLPGKTPEGEKAEVLFDFVFKGLGHM